ncbi:hypothetical protein ACFFGR_15970 [Arthrobacter liuii]|uniref:hypothetical protein n=1 Tax=Arthrobacter liuii TaxID=1476996 RepID=UPI001E5BABF7|nr:hypothetical protein [Arthrobacter liuii]
MPLVLSGFGPVGQAFAETVLEQDCGLRIAAVRGHTAEVFPAPGSVVPERSSWMPLRPIGETLALAGAGILVQALPSSVEAHAHALEEASAALRSGVDVVTATKSHILSSWRDLERAAAEGKSRIRISAATGAALPTADLARVALRGMGCAVVRACPNGTSTFVLDQLCKALAAAQQGLRLRAVAGAHPWTGRWRSLCSWKPWRQPSRCSQSPAPKRQSSSAAPKPGTSRCRAAVPAREEPLWPC